MPSTGSWGSGAERPPRHPGPPSARGGLPGSGRGGEPASLGGAPKGPAKKAAPTGARTYTSRYRGVHQTFPTRRWEAQFRRNGKPTSLGCFDGEEEAARAYDKMMLWTELHGAAAARPPTAARLGTTNFPAASYAAEVPALRAMTQEELVQELRRVGRAQAAAAAAAAKCGGGRGDRAAGGVGPVVEAAPGSGEAAAAAAAPAEEGHQA